MELMKQRQYTPMSVGMMAISLFAVEKGYLDDIEKDSIDSFESALQDFISSNYTDELKMIDSEGNYNEELESKLTKILDEFKKTGSW